MRFSRPNQRRILTIMQAILCKCRRSIAIAISGAVRVAHAYLKLLLQHFAAGLSLQRSGCTVWTIVFKSCQALFTSLGLLLWGTDPMPAWRGHYRKLSLQLQVNRQDDGALMTDSREMVSNGNGREWFVGAIDGMWELFAEGIGNGV